MAQLLATQASKDGCNVEVVTASAGSSKADDKPFPFTIFRTRNLRDWVSAFKRSDVILFMNVPLRGVSAALFSGVPIILIHHGVFRGRGLRGKLLGFLKRQVTRICFNISVSEFVSHNIPAKSVVIRNPYDNSVFSWPAHPKRTRDYVFCGRLVSNKGVGLCLDAFMLVLKIVPDASLTIVGDGPERELVHDLVDTYRLTDRVSCTGALTGRALELELQRHACMLVPSLCDEGFGIVALEGIACCDTVIVSRRGGLPEAVGECGLVVEPTVKELSDVMVSVAKARRSNKRLPGSVDQEVRNQHLASHRPAAVMRRYSEVMEGVLSRSQ